MVCELSVDEMGAQMQTERGSVLGDIPPTAQTHLLTIKWEFIGCKNLLGQCGNLLRQCRNLLRRKNLLGQCRNLLGCLYMTQLPRTSL